MEEHNALIFCALFWGVSLCGFPLQNRGNNSDEQYGKDKGVSPLQLRHKGRSNDHSCQHDSIEDVNVAEPSFFVE